jgi:TonB family protein
MAMSRMFVTVLVSVLLVGSLVARQDTPEPPFAPGIVRVPHAGIVSPTPTYKVRPTYTPAAREAKIQGTVTLECVVKADGTIGDVRVVKSVDKEYGLDDQAVKAAKAWRFTAAKDGTESISSVVTLTFPFVLGD